MDPDALDYDLPPEAIAQVPVEPRDAARLLVDRGPEHAPEHRSVADLADFVGPGDLLIVNDTRVRPARLRLHKTTGGAVEVLLLDDHGDGIWDALVRPGRRVPDGTVLEGAGGQLRVEVGSADPEGVRTVRIEGDPTLHGEVPLPPYIHTPLADSERYQTVYSRRPTSAAAPTAGLHLTDAVLDRCRATGATVAAIELSVGVDTFRPITAKSVEDHPMHSEAYVVPESTWDACSAADRVLAVGTTVVRALESAAATGALHGRTDLLIHRGYRFAVVDRLLTNFHVPRSTLIALVDAFIGSRWRELYDAALAEGYRFLSFGDAMLLERSC